MNGFDDELRDALAAGGPDRPRPDFDDVRRRARSSQQRRRAGTSLAAIVGLLAAGVLTWSLATGGDGPETHVIIDQPTTTTVTAAPGARPPTALIVTTDGHVSLYDIDAGASFVDLGRYEHQVDEETGMAYYIDDVARTPDESTYYVSLCCEPASGRVLRLPEGGAAPMDPSDPGQSFGEVWLVRPSPVNDDRVVVSMYAGLSVTTADAGVTEAEFDDPDYPWPADELGVGSLAWSPDGRRLVWTSTDATSVVVGDVVSDDEIRVAARHDAPEGAQWRQATFRRDGKIVLVESRHEEADRGLVVDPATGEVVADFPFDGNVLTLGYDPSGTWLLVVYDDGRAVGMGGGEVFPVATGIALADW